MAPVTKKLVFITDGGEERLNSLKRFSRLAVILTVLCFALCVSVSANLFDGSTAPAGQNLETSGTEDTLPSEGQKETFPPLYAFVNAGAVSEQGSLRFDLSLEPGEDSDFVTAFPEELSRNEETVLLPVPEPPARVMYPQIPTFFQEDYPAVLYGSGTVETNGSSVTALAMLTSYLTGYAYYPDELARCFAGKADTDVARVSYALEAMGLPFEIYEAWQESEEPQEDEELREGETSQEPEVRQGILDALREGKYALVQLSKNSLFAKEEHFVILMGVTEEGKIQVKDPLDANNQKESLTESFALGFDESVFRTSAGYIWVLDPAAVPEELARYTEPAQIGEETRYDSLKLTPSEKQFFARLLYVAAHGECMEGKQALIEVILNQLLSEAFPDTLKEIVYGENGLCEAGLLHKAKPGQLEYLAVEKAIYGPYILEEDITDFSYICHTG